MDKSSPWTPLEPHGPLGACGAEGPLRPVHVCAPAYAQAPGRCVTPADESVGRGHLSFVLTHGGGGGLLAFRRDPSPSPSRSGPKAPGGGGRVPEPRRPPPPPPRVLTAGKELVASPFGKQTGPGAPCPVPHHDPADHEAGGLGGKGHACARVWGGGGCARAGTGVCGVRVALPLPCSPPSALQAAAEPAQHTLKCPRLAQVLILQQQPQSGLALKSEQTWLALHCCTYGSLSQIAQCVRAHTYTHAAYTHIHSQYHDPSNACCMASSRARMLASTAKGGCCCTVCTLGTINGQTPVIHPKMHPPKRPAPK